MVRAFALVLVALLAAACASVDPGARGTDVQPPSPPSQPSAPPLPPTAEPPPPPINLSGFPLPYRQGYSDGCASTSGAERKDAQRFIRDANYRTGWQDGFSLCKKK